MRSICRIMIITALALSPMGCEDEEIIVRDFPGIRTLDVTNITANGAQLNAEIIFRGDIEILSYGFVWLDDDPRLSYANKVDFQQNIKSGKFSAEISTDLEEGTRHLVRAFLVTADYLIYGKLVTFVNSGRKAP